MKRQIIKNSAISLCILLTTSCATHTGYIQNSTSLSSDNFTYLVKDVMGSSKITYIPLIGGLFSGINQESLIGDAKKDLLSKNPLKSNQSLANITVGWKHTFVLPFAVTHKCVITADIVEFSSKKESGTSNSSTSNSVKPSLDINFSSPGTPTISSSNNPTPPSSNINFSSIGSPIGKFGNGIKDIDGNSYKTTILGTQEWMAENLKVTKYNDGKSITLIKDSNSWIQNTNGAYCNYKDTDSLGNIYGKLYNWFAVNTNKVCPSGWHVPSTSDWFQLTSYLGGSSGLGGKLREVEFKHWIAPDNNTKTATNTSLFTALPGGLRFGEIGVNNYKKIYFWSMKNSGYLWTNQQSSIDDKKANYIQIGKNNETFSSDDILKSTGLSIRCLKD
jgi:uncharacterized protein (TIGR02145 family)